jgi:uncharacterized RDD family membrane protein YckC
LIESHVKEKKMAQSISTPPIAATDVHVTGRRVLATIADALVLGLLFGVMSMLFGSSSVEGGQANATLSGPAFLAYLVLAFAYYMLMEGYLGQTLGKMLLGIKVVREDTGGVPGLKTAAIRTVLRIVDGFLSYLVAFIAVLASQKNQRLGDMAANTLVVRK